MPARGGVRRGFFRLSDRLGGSGSTFVSQVSVNTIDEVVITVPAGAAFMFAEGLGAGGDGGKSSTPNATGSGGEGSDLIVAVSPGQLVNVLVSQLSGASLPGNPTTIKLSGTIVLSCAGGMHSVNGVAPIVQPTPGKYPGERGSTTTGTGSVRAKGGGRLAGSAAVGTATTIGRHGGPGAGSLMPTSNGSIPGYPGAACVTFFTTQDAALAFAQSVYNGAWVA